MGKLSTARTMAKLLIPSRWQKLLQDMARNKTRTLLVVLSIAVGVAAIGIVRNAHHMTERNLFEAFMSTNPHSASLNLSPFPGDLADDVRNFSTVKNAQARKFLNVEAVGIVAATEDLSLIAVPDYDRIEVDTLLHIDGAFKPGIRQVLLERETAKYLSLNIGDTLEILKDDRTYSLEVTGIVHDLSRTPPSFFGITYGYVSIETMQWLGESPYFDTLDIVTTEPADNLDHVLAVIKNLKERVLQPAGIHLYSIFFTRLSNAPRSYWAAEQVNGIYVVMDAMGILCILLSAGLVINTISAILSQQVREIGILRSVGARRRQIFQMYMVNVVTFSMMALVIALPLGLIGSRLMSRYIAIQMNLDLTRMELYPDVLLLQIAIGLVVPLAAGLAPIYHGSRISVFDAFYSQGLSQKGSSDWINRSLNRFRQLTRPLSLAVRNTFRKKTRLAFTLITLTLAGGMFISVFSTRTSLMGQLDEINRYLNFDISIHTFSTVKLPTAEREAARIPGVESVEGWAIMIANISYPNNRESSDLLVYSTPHENPTTMDLDILDGTWLNTLNPNGIVISKDVLDENPDLEVGDDIVLDILDRRHTFHIIGLSSRFVAQPVIFMNYDTYSRVSGRSMPVSQVRLHLTPEQNATRAGIDQALHRLEEHFETAGLSSSEADTFVETLDRIAENFTVILIFLVIMASLLAVVGGLGLAGTMSMNVLERTREIGVLRAVGASNRDVRKIVLVEGMVIGVTSWVLGVLLALPLGKALSNAVGTAVFNDTIRFYYSVTGAVVWLILAVLIGAVASIAPAQRASSLTVREVLAYE
ncbi:MAG: FtsX-like permease family protein [Anaerolineales bacterium]|nr:FtsX-like permease family protein [Anaerolineales bacterium]